MTEPGPWRRMVLLRHELPDGTHHFDWMLERDDEGPLATWRAAVRLDALAPDDAAALEPVADHRRAYLEREGELSGGRGTVARLASGLWRDAGPAAHGRWIELRWALNDAPQRRELGAAGLGPVSGRSAGGRGARGALD